MTSGWRFEDLIDAKLEAILARPSAWGAENVLEPLVLTLLQLRIESIQGSEAGAAMRRRYRTHLREQIGSGPLPLIERLAAHGSSLSAVAVLRSFWIAERSIARQADQHIFNV